MVSKNAPAFILIFCLSILAGCKSKDPSFIENMPFYLDLATDLHLWQIAIEQAPENQRDSLHTLYQKTIFQLYNIKEQDIVSFYSALTAHPKEASMFYDSLQVIIQRKLHAAVE